MALQIIVEGKLDYAEGKWLIWPGGASYPRHISTYIHPYIGKHIVISYEEPEEESVGLMEKLAGSMRRALAPAPV